MASAAGDLRVNKILVNTHLERAISMSQFIRDFKLETRKKLKCI